MTTQPRNLVPVRISPALVRLVNAPGFSAETFARSLHRARTVRGGAMTLSPMGGGRVRVDSGSGGVYVTTRSTCTCKGHVYGPGYCYHRAACVAAADLDGIDLRHETVIGFDASGRAVTTGYEEAA